MSLLLDILNAIIYLIVSLVIISFLGVIYLGFVFYVLIKEFFVYIYRKVT